MSTAYIKTAVAGLAFALYGVGGWAQPAQLDQYIRQALESNAGLKQQQFSLAQSLYALQEARSLFLPSVSFLSSYTKAAGGRTIDVPIGDLLNPAYATLNQLTGSSKFPTLANQSFLLNPDNFYDAKLRTSMPLINTEIWYNRKIKQQVITQQQAAVNVYKRELVKNIKTAYYQYYQAGKAVDIYRSTLNLVRENIRVNESLLRNGVRNSTALTRSQTERERTEASLVQAENNRRNAQAYFNFLLNRPLQDSILLDTTAFADPVVQLPADTSGGTGMREELEQLRSVKKINELGYSLARSYLVPKLSTFLDLGSQGTAFTWDNKTRYYLWGINLEWNIFSGGKNKARSKQAEAEIQAVQAQYDQTQQSLQLQLTQSFNNYRSAVAGYTSARAQVVLATKYYRDQLKAYKEGQLLYLELVDAQNQLTNAQLQLAQTFAGVQVALAQLERDEASYPLNP
jgi:outer membrane protein TolC